MSYLIKYECPVKIKIGKKLSKKDQVPSVLIDQLNDWLTSNSLYHCDLVTNLSDSNIIVNHIFPGKLSYSPGLGAYAEFDAFITGFHNDNFAKQIGDIGIFIKSQITGDWGKDGFDCDVIPLCSVEFDPSQFRCVNVNVVDEFYVKAVIDDFNSKVMPEAQTYIEGKAEKSKIENILSGLKDLERQICT